MKLRIGTRGSALARAQTADVARRLAQLGHGTETVVISTAGDRHRASRFADVGAFGIFVRDIEEALLAGRIDVAVHSFKDVPSRGPDALAVAAVPERLDPADMLVARRDATSSSSPGLPLPEGATVGTASARRQALLRHLRPDLRVVTLRGNVPTRLRAVVEGRVDAVVLAAAGLARLEQAGQLPPVRERLVTTRLDPAIFVPAPAQGAIAVQARRHDRPVWSAAAALDDPAASRPLQAERALLARADAGCTTPFGAWCGIESGTRLTLTAVLGRDGGLVRHQASGDDPDALVEVVWQALMSGMVA